MQNSNKFRILGARSNLRGIYLNKLGEFEKASSTVLEWGVAPGLECYLCRK
jgi:hypothetical protein